jgi:hypothetical protein
MLDADSHTSTESADIGRIFALPERKTYSFEDKVVDFAALMEGGLA